MSTRIMAICWPLAMPPAPKSVLISLADNANDQGVCWPSLPTICERTCLGRTAVIEAIRWLENHQALTVDRSASRSNRYNLTPQSYGVQSAMFGARGEPSAKRTVRDTDGPADAPQQCATRTVTVRQTDPNRKEPSRTERENALALEVGTAAGRACRAMGQAGCVRMNPSNPNLQAALAEGVTVQMLVDTVREAIESGIDEPFPWAIKVSRKRHAAGADPVSTNGVRDGPRRHGKTVEGLSGLEELKNEIRGSGRVGGGTGAAPDALGIRGSAGG